jgi:hypothetical protein
VRWARSSVRSAGAAPRLHGVLGEHPPRLQLRDRRDVCFELGHARVGGRELVFEDFDLARHELRRVEVEPGERILPRGAGVTAMRGKERRRRCELECSDTHTLLHHAMRTLHASSALS